MKMDRYFVDERCGIVTIRDRENTDPSRPGLQASTGGVVRFWRGMQSIKRCPTCGHEQWDKWVIADADIDAAHAMCNKLNQSGKNDDDRLTSPKTTKEERNGTQRIRDDAKGPRQASKRL